MALLLAVVVSSEVAVAIVLSRMLNPGLEAAPSITAYAAVLVASLVALLGSVLLAAASAVSYARLREPN